MAALAPKKTAELVARLKQSDLAELLKRGQDYVRTASGFTSIASRSKWTRKSPWRDLAARSSILPSAAAVPIGRGGKKATRMPQTLFR